MKFVGSVRSGEGQSLKQRVYSVDTLERLIPGTTSAWITGFIKNLSYTETLIVNFFNASREDQIIDLPPRAILVVKNQNCERLNLLSPDYKLFAYYFNSYLAESDQEAGDLLINSTLDIRQTDTELAAVQRQRFELTSGQTFRQENDLDRQLLITGIRAWINPLTLPAQEPDYRGYAELNFTWRGDQDQQLVDFGSVVMPLRPGSTYLPDLDWSYPTIGTPLRNAGLRVDAASSVNTVSMEGIIEYLSV